MGWFFVNILVPVFAPLALLLPFRPFRAHLPEDARRHLRWWMPLKDGQLGWAGLAFCSAAAYELEDGPFQSTTTAHGLLAGLVVVLLGNCFLAALGGVFPSEPDVPDDVPPWRHYPVLMLSVWLASVSALALAGVHFWNEGASP